MKLHSQIYAFYLMLVFSNYGLSQNVNNYNNNWVYSVGHSFDFSTGTPSYLTGTSLLDPNSEGVSSISDGNGNLLFYTEGESVYDANHNPMPNGNGTINGMV
jgi:hypothetical protein